MTDTELMEYALNARRNAYAPYSGFAVGAALLCPDGTVYTGCNVENASYSVTCCAERSALFAAVSAGKRNFSAIAVAGGRQGETPDRLFMPCGVCRQALAEFCKSDFPVLVYDGKAVRRFTLGGLLSHGFSADAMQEDRI